MKAMFTNQDFQLDAGSEIVPSRCIIDENDKSKNISLLCDINCLTFLLKIQVPIIPQWIKVVIICHRKLK